MNDLDSVFNDDWPENHRSGVITIVGHPNVGKSTLINRILKQKIAIATPTPQTTRRQQLGIYTSDEAQILFVDTPGIHAPHHKLGEFMVNTAQSSLHDVDAVLWVIDVSQPPNDEDRGIAELLAKFGHTPIVVAFNKIDKVPESSIEGRAEPYLELLSPTASYRISAENGDGVDELLDALAAYLPEGPRYYPKEQVSEVNLRFIAAEIIREQVILQTHDEIPHAVAVGIDSFEERDNGTFKIYATIYVEKESQKGIVIGNRGSMIKTLGSDARQEIKQALGHDTQLFLHVKVLKNWRSDPKLMRKFGYIIEKDSKR